MESVPPVGRRRGLPPWLLEAGLALGLFGLLLALSWRRWASFEGDLNREWTTPMRLASGERLYRDVAYYYGPLAPWLEAALFRLLGPNVGTAIGFGIATAAGTLAALFLAARLFLPLAGRLAVIAVAAGVLAFAPDNGAFVACYSQGALLAVGLSWGSFLLAARPSGAAALPAALALLAKAEAAPALAGLFPLLGRRAVPILAAAAALAGLVLLASVAGIPVADLVTFGPLRHAAMPPEFRELYLRVSGLHPALAVRGVGGAVAGALLAGGFAGLAGALVAQAGRRALATSAASAALALGGAAWWLLGAEPLLTTGVRGLPVLCVAALVAALLARRRHPAGAPARREPSLVAGAALVGLGFSWRTFFWTVPSLPYAPLAAVSTLPAAVWLCGVALVGKVPDERRARASALALAPFLLAPLLFAPRLVEAYRSPRQAVVAPRGTWLPPGEEGPLFSALVAHLRARGVADRSLVVVPEASALNFLLGARSPLRLEQLLPGLVDERADELMALALEASPPARAVVLERPTPEFGTGAFGRDHARRIAAFLARDYVVEARFQVPGSRPGHGTATVLVRRPRASPPP